jgi:hypothetical protein
MPRFKDKSYGPSLPMEGDLKVTTSQEVTPILLSVMIVVAGAAVLLFALGAFDELRDLWSHPDHRPVEDEHPFPHHKSK